MPRRHKGAKLPLTQGEFLNVLRADESVSSPLVHLRNVAAWSFQINTSLRISDVLAANVGDVFTPSGTVHRSMVVIQRKTHAPVLIRLAVGLTRPLRLWWETYAKLCGHAPAADWPLFCSLAPAARHRFTLGEDPVRLKHSALFEPLVDACAWAGLDPKRYGTHSLRASLPAAFYLDTGDVLGAQQLFGHLSPITTTRYLSKVAVRRAWNARESHFFSVAMPRKKSLFQAMTPAACGRGTLVPATKALSYFARREKLRQSGGTPL